MEIAIIGTGAIGGYYGARLAHSKSEAGHSGAEHNVHFLFHSDYEYVKSHGMTVDSHYGDFSLSHPNVYAHIEDMPPCDLVCVAVKTTVNEQIFDRLGAVLKKDGAILLMQNGFGYEQMLHSTYPDHPILAGMCFICSFRDGPGVIRHTDYGKLTLAVLGDDALSLGTLAEVAQAFKDACVDTEVKDDLIEARIRKLMWNIPYNGMSVIAGCQTDTLTGNPSLRKATRAVMEEIIEAAEACGKPIEKTFVDVMVKLTDDMTPYDPSMRLDYLADRPLEIEAIYSNFIDYAEKHGYDMRCTKMMRWQLQYLQDSSGK